jgi:hypothetical protein
MDDLASNSPFKAIQPQMRLMGLVGNARGTADAARGPQTTLLWEIGTVAESPPPSSRSARSRNA